MIIGGKSRCVLPSLKIVLIVLKLKTYIDIHRLINLFGLKKKKEKKQKERKEKIKFNLIIYPFVQNINFIYIYKSIYKCHI